MKIPFFINSAKPSPKSPHRALSVLIISHLAALELSSYILLSSHKVRSMSHAMFAIAHQGSLILIYEEPRRRLDGIETVDLKKTAIRSSLSISLPISIICNSLLFNAFYGFPAGAIF